MEIEQAQKILDLPPEADLNQVKKAYRKLAFRFHPDLNPDKPDAVSRFQEINKAYILLKQVSSAENKGPEPHPESAREKPGKKDKARKEKSTSDYGYARGKHRQKFHFRQEEVLRDILNDPFAKKVFEDIFERVKKNKGPGTEIAPSKKSLSLQWGERRLEMDLSHGFFGGIKKWLSSQLDDEQTVYLSPQKMLPGSKIHIQIGRRLGGETKSITVNIPSDYVAGRPLRLKKLGRSLGPWKGDLYLRLLAR